MRLLWRLGLILAWSRISKSDVNSADNLELRPLGSYIGLRVTEVSFTPCLFDKSRDITGYFCSYDPFRVKSAIFLHLDFRDAPCAVRYLWTPYCSYVRDASDCLHHGLQATILVWFGHLH